LQRDTGDGGYDMKTRYYVLIAAILVLLIGGWFYFTSNKPATTPTNNQPSSTSQTNNPSSESQDQNQKTTPATYPVSVYFSKHPDSDDDPGKTFAVKRTSPDIGVAKYAIAEILKGPNANEISEGYFTTVALRDATSVCSGQDFTVVIKDGTATLKFCRPFDHRGVVADGQADSELKATLKQFSSVNKVVILNWQDNCEFDLSGQNLCKQ
jgi:hypothetical protein